MEDYILEHFDEALEKNWIKVYFQPIVRSLTGDVCGAEALARWIDPDRGMINPSDLYLFWKRMDDFGRPDTPEEALNHCVEKGMKIETRPEEEYYDKIGRLDFMDSRSMALFEDDVKVVKNIFANEEYRLALKSNGTRTMAEAERKINHVGQA